jgi:hypothetical protein
VHGYFQARFFHSNQEEHLHVLVVDCPKFMVNRLQFVVN